MTEAPLDWEEVWYLEKFDLNIDGWNGLHPYVEHLCEASARQEYAERRREIPGGQPARVVHEVRSRTIVRTD